MNKGQIIRIISNLYTVKINNNYYDCRARGKFRNENITPVVGDYVKIDLENNYILEILPRKNYFTRPLIANIDTALIVTSLKEPNLSLNLLDKQITNLLAKNIIPIIVLTKKDLCSKLELKKLKPIINYYQKNLNIKVLYNNNLWSLKHLLKNKLVVLTGQTGAGKSTLINKLGHLSLETQAISKSLGRGKHTTRHVEIYDIGKFRLADTPGFSAYDLKDLTVEELKNTFIEFQKYICKYKDCHHTKEQDCAVKKEVGRTILPSRYENYLQFLGEIKCK